MEKAGRRQKAGAVRRKRRIGKKDRKENGTAMYGLLYPRYAKRLSAPPVGLWKSRRRTRTATRLTTDIGRITRVRKRRTAVLPLCFFPDSPPDGKRLRRNIPFRALKKAYSHKEFRQAETPRNPIRIPRRSRSDSGGAFVSAVTNYTLKCNL